MMPDNIIVGDYQTGIDLPQATPEEASLNEEKKMAKYSRSTEFKKLREKVEARITFYKTFLPDGRPVAVVSKQERIDAWDGANLVIMELTSLMDGYDYAAEAVDGEKSA